MLLFRARIQKFRSIEDSTPVDIDGSITALVGQNESGKTAFLKALYRAAPADDLEAYELTDDYPRHELLDYEDTHEDRPAIVAHLEYSLESTDLIAIQKALGVESSPRTISVRYDYAGETTPSIQLQDTQREFLSSWISSNDLSTDTLKALESASTVDDYVSVLEQRDRNESEDTALEELKQRFPQDSAWTGDRFGAYCWREIFEARVPRFLYFDDYRVLPGKVNLLELQNRHKRGNLTPSDQGVLRLLSIARIDIESLARPGGYEKGKARLEATSTKISRKIFQYWRQNRDLRVEFDVKADPDDVAPYNSGENLYIRVYNPKHGVTVPFDQRSKGFVWFFSFLAWFDGLQKHEGEPDRRLILLLDEPGLSLHALAQADYLQYIEKLSESHQIVYTTHSPFMIDSSKLNRTRSVEDKLHSGTVVSSHMSDSSEDTLFPLQAALGYSIAQNLFISNKNLLVEGASDLILLQTMSDLLVDNGRVGLDKDSVITPVGGLQKISSFVSLFNANHLRIAVLHDYDGTDEQSLQNLVRERILAPRSILHYALFRNGSSDGNIETDIEDLFPTSYYLEVFCHVYSAELGEHLPRVQELPEHPRIIRRIEKYLSSKGIKVRPSGGYNHFRVAKNLSASLADSVPEDALRTFEELFKRVNSVIG